jgi:hypothetical protein
VELLQPVRQQARHDLLLESHTHPAVKCLRQTPAIGPIRAALLVALLQTPHRFRTKRRLWAYSGFALETHDSGEYRMVKGKARRNRERLTVLGLNDNHNHDLKNLFKGAALSASTRPGPLYDFYVGLLGEGDATNHGTSHLSPKDCHHHFNHVEERSGFRRPTIESASSLSVSGEQAFPSPVIFSAGGRSGSRDARFEGKYQVVSSALCASAPSH